MDHRCRMDGLRRSLALERAELPTNRAEEDTMIHKAINVVIELVRPVDQNRDFSSIYRFLCPASFVLSPSGVRHGTHESILAMPFIVCHRNASLCLMLVTNTPHLAPPHTFHPFAPVRPTLPFHLPSYLLSHPWSPLPLQPPASPHKAASPAVLPLPRAPCSAPSADSPGTSSAYPPSRACTRRSPFSAAGTASAASRRAASAGSPRLCCGRPSRSRSSGGSRPGRRLRGVCSAAGCGRGDYGLGVGGCSRRSLQEDGIV